MMLFASYISFICMGRHLGSDKEVKFFVFVSGEYPTSSSPSIRGENGQQVAQWVLPGIQQNSPALKVHKIEILLFWFWNLYYFFVSYVKILRFNKKNFDWAILGGGTDFSA